MARYCVALDNKLTSERGLMGYVEVYHEARVSEPKPVDIYLASGLFPRHIASRAAKFGIVDAENRDDLIRRYGPEIE